MKKFHLVSVLVISAMLLGMFVMPASAMPGGTWQSGIKIQNLLDTGDAQPITVFLYAPAGGDPAYTISQTATGDPLEVAPGTSVEVFLPSFADIDGGQYSAVITSLANIGAVVTTTNYGYGLADSYNNMLAPSTTVLVPSVYHNHNNWSTEIFIQNTTASDAHVTVDLVEPASASSASDGLGDMLDIPFTIPAGGTVSVDTTKADYADLGWFIGGATITSDVDVAVAANQTRLVGTGDVKGNVMISARGLTNDDAGTSVMVPSLYKDFAGASGTWKSGIKIANPGDPSTTAHVTVTFNSDPGVTPVVEDAVKTVEVVGGQNTELYLPNMVLDDTTSLPAMFRGYAVITSDIDVIATVQHTNYAGGAGYGVAIGYSGFAYGTNKISLPSLYNWPSGAGVWVSGIKVQNYGAVDATFDISFVPDPNSISMKEGTITGVTLTPDEAVEFYFGSMELDDGTKIPSGWKGSAIITGAGSDELVATVIHTNYGRHVSNMYTGIPIP